MGAPLGTPEAPLRVAVIGSGPSAFYAAEHLQEQDHLEVQIDMYDRLPTPYGLVRGGVAPGSSKDQDGDPSLRQDRRPPRVPLLRQRRDGPRHTHDDLIGATTTRSSTRSAPAPTGAWGSPREAPARQPLRHRVRRLVQRAPGLTATSASTWDRGAAAVVGNGNVAMDVARILASSLRGTRADRHRRARPRSAQGEPRSATSTCSVAAAPPRRPSPTRS